MPIRPERMHRYPGGSIRSPEWRAFVELIRERSGDQCEGWRLGVYPDCRAVNGEPHPVTGSRVVLTVAHLNHDESCTDPEQVAHACQRCHCTYDIPHRQANARRRREADQRRGMPHVQGNLFEIAK